MPEKKFREKIQTLVDVIKNTIISEKRKGVNPFQIGLFNKWEVASMKYSDAGFHLSMRGKPIKKPFTYPTSQIILGILQKTPEYHELIEFTKTNTQIEENPENLVNYFLIRTIEKYFADETTFDSHIQEGISALIADLKNEPNKTKTVVEFYGVILQVDKITLSSDVVLRRPIEEDFNIETIYLPIIDHPNFPEPGAMLEFTIHARNRTDIQREIAKTVSILQLFKPMNITWHIYKVKSDSVNPCFKRNDPPIEKHLRFQNTIIQEQEVNRLQEFWNEISKVLPKNFDQIDTKKFDYKSIAYNRYNESLSQRESLERNITSAIMGLEAIYFKPTGERDELKYRLAMRVSKILGLLSSDSLKIKNVIRDAYIIRSIFAHGGHISNLSPKEKRHFSDQYGIDYSKLLSLLQDYLRLSIIISLSIKKQKEQFLTETDNAMIDPNTNQLLINDLEFGMFLANFTKEPTK